jgi:hypothetical protein
MSDNNTWRAAMSNGHGSPDESAAPQRRRGVSESVQNRDLLTDIEDAEYTELGEHLPVLARTFVAPAPNLLPPLDSPPVVDLSSDMDMEPVAEATPIADLAPTVDAAPVANASPSAGTESAPELLPVEGRRPMLDDSAAPDDSALLDLFPDLSSGPLLDLAPATEPAPVPDPSAAPDGPQALKGSPPLDSSRVVASNPALDSEPVEDHASVLDLSPATADEPVVEKPVPTVSAKQAYLTGPNALSLLNPELADDVDELNGLFSSMSEVPVGSYAVAQLDLRAYKGFKGEAQAYIAQLKDPAANTGSGWGARFMSVARALGWGLSRLMNEGAAATPPPWRREHAKPIPVSQMTQSMKEQIAAAERKATEDRHFEAQLRVYAGGAPENEAKHDDLVSTMTSKFAHFTTAHQGLGWEDSDGIAALNGQMPIRAKGSMVLSASEAAELARIPDDLTQAHGVTLDRSSIEWVEPDNPTIIADPLDPPAGLLPIGQIRVDSEDEAVVGLSNEDLNTHGLVVGRTGTGKSEFFKWQILGAVKAGYPIIVIDPHGQLANGVVRDIIAHAPEHVHRITFVDTSDSQYPVAINPLDVDRPDQVSNRVKMVQDMMASQFNLNGAPRAQNILFLALSALCEANLVLRSRGARLCSILHVLNFFTDAEFRRYICEMSTNISVREFFDPEGAFEQASQKQQAELYGPIEHRLRRLQGDDLFANSLGVSENRLDWPTLMREKRIVVVKLALLSEQAEIGAFIGNLLLPMILNTMMQWGRKQNASTGDPEGIGARIFVDEAPTVLPKDDPDNDAANRILNEARKADVGLVLASQFLAQYDAMTMKTVIANTASKFVLTQDVASAAPLAKNLGVDAEAISLLPNFHAFVSARDAQGQRSGTFTVRLLKPLTTMTPKVAITDDERRRQYDAVLGASRAQLTNPAAQIKADVFHAVEHIKVALSQELVERTESGLPQDGDGMGVEAGATTLYGMSPSVMPGAATSWIGDAAIRSAATNQPDDDFGWEEGE